MWYAVTIDLELILVRDTQQVSKMFGIDQGSSLSHFSWDCPISKKVPMSPELLFGTPKCAAFLFGTFLIRLTAVMQYVRILHLASSVFVNFGFR
jgi:hypothetical protein